MVTQIWIRTFDASGERANPMSVGAIERLLSMSLVIVKRNPKGQIKFAQFRPLNGFNPLSRSAHAGTRYSWLEHVGDDSAYRAWKHKPLLEPKHVEQIAGEPIEDPAILDLYVQAIFRAVPLSCMRRTKKASAIPIDSKLKKKARPCWESPDPPAARKIA